MQPAAARRLALISTVAVLAAACVTCAAPGPPVPARDYELRDEQRRDFNRIIDRFTREVFPRCMKESGLVLSCSGCEYAYIIVRLQVGADGKLKGYDKVRENVCGRAAPAKLERCFIEYMESLTFPRSVRSMVIETRLGNGLRC